MAKKILTIGLDLASDAAHEEEFRSKASLLDWDIVLFKPDIFELTLQRETEHRGKPSLTDSASFALKEACTHWHQEIKQAIETGKTVVVFLPSIQEVYVASGQYEYSGTGWAEFSTVSEYKVLLPTDAKGTCLVTKHGDRPVGAILRSQTSSGSLVLLPDIDFYPKRFFNDTDDDDISSDEAKQFAARMIDAMIALDRALHASSDFTPEPSWASDPKFAVPKELSLRSELLKRERLVEEAQKKKEEVQEQLKAAGQLRSLLYEKGKSLENSIIEALRILGFRATAYKDAESEFDVVFESSEGRLLGEVEGKDSKAVNVDKLRQLTMNLHEDLQREEVLSPAKGVLFGNGYRLKPPQERENQFTQKCITAAEASSTALVATTDLYAVVQYLSDQTDEDYARRCREALLVGVGVVKLPPPPPTASDVVAETSIIEQA